MQIVPINTHVVPSRPSALERPTPVRGGERVNELLSHTRTYQSEERVLQGELLEGDAEPVAGTRPYARVYDSRPEDHPAFYRRQANQEYIQRQALAAYRMQAAVGAAAVPGSGVDYFV